MPFHMVDIIHAGAAYAFVIKGEPAGLDDMAHHSHTGAEPQDAAHVLGDIGLIKRNMHSGSLHSPDQARQARVEQKTMRAYVLAVEVTGDMIVVHQLCWQRGLRRHEMLIFQCGQ